MNKQAVSTIVASVFVIMLSVFAVAILFTFVMPTVDDNLQEAAREPVELSIQTSGGYTIWDETNKLAKVQIRRGDDDNDLEGVRFQFIKETDTIEHTSEDIPSAGQVKTYSFILGDFGRPEAIKITAIVDGKEVTVQGASEVGSGSSDGGSDSVKDGTGSDSDITTAPYIGPDCFDAVAGTICTCEDLQNMETNLSGNYFLQNKINCSATSDGSSIWDSEGFDPIGQDSPYFTGSLDGQGHVISDLRIVRVEDYVGLFGRTAGANIGKVGLENFYVDGRDYVGGLIGAAAFTTTNISNVYVAGISVGGGSNPIWKRGGLIGESTGVNILNSYTTGVVSGENSGGLVGKAMVTQINDSFSSASISGATNVGGIVGYYSYGNSLSNLFWLNQTEDSATNCYSGGDAGCTERHGSEQVLFYSDSYEPMASWDTKIWDFSGTDYPTLKFQN